MGKVRRLRQKYHLLKKPEKKEEVRGLTYEEVVAGTNDKVHLSLSSAEDNKNIFSGINIDFNELKTSLNEDDNRSVRSIAKSLKYDSNGKLLKKDEKRKLRHEIFMKKLDSLYQMRSENKKKKKKSKKPNVQNTIAVPDELPQLVSVENPKKLKLVKKKGIEKAKIRQKNLMEDISAFRKILANPDFKANPLGMISSCVQNKVLEEDES